ncbi:MAG: family 10 glycosylhydrolase [Candidatus Melainabacteria bacterium]|nr:family 10 glycosylhydrolase [Candidatus Melainabacteria bacterium]
MTQIHPRAGKVFNGLILFFLSACCWISSPLSTFAEQPSGEADFACILSASSAQKIAAEAALQATFGQSSLGVCQPSSLLSQASAEEVTASNRLLLVSLDQKLDETTALALQQAIRRGQFIVFMGTETPTPVENELLEPLALTLGLTHLEKAATPTLSALPLETVLPSLLPPLSTYMPTTTWLLQVTSPLDQEKVLANWGQQTPAILIGPQGVLLNWPVGANYLSTEQEGYILRGLLSLLKERNPKWPQNPPFSQYAAENKPESTPDSTSTAPRIFMSLTPPELPQEQTLPAQPGRLPAKDATPAQAQQKLAPSTPPGATSKKSESPSPEKAPTEQVIGQHPQSQPGPSQSSPSQPSPAGTTGAEMTEADPLEALLDQEEGEAKSQNNLPGKSTENANAGDPYAKVNYGLYYRKTRDLEDLKMETLRRIEMGKALGRLSDSKTLLRQLTVAEKHQRQFESYYLSGETELGLQSYRAAVGVMMSAISEASPSSRVEGRALWLDRGSIVHSETPDGLRALIRRFHAAGVNILFIEALNAGYPLYNSAILPKNPLIGSWDPLKVAVDEAHQLGMEAHAWVWTFAVGNTRHNAIVGMPHRYAGPVLEEKGLMSEALRTSSGSIMPPRQTEYWLSPGSPRARSFLKSVFSEIVQNYPVDGLHLDYIRYPFQTPAVPSGYESVARARFENESHLSLSSMTGSTYAAWTQWKTRQVNSFVKEVSQTLRQQRPGIRLSAAVFPIERANRLRAIQQDWETWVAEGWLDTLHPMSYTTSPARLNRILSRVQQSVQGKAVVYPGVGLHRLDEVGFLLQLDEIRRAGFMGATLFAATHLNQDRLTLLENGPYRERHPAIPHQNGIASVQSLLEDYAASIGRIQQQPGIDQESDASALEPLQATLGQIKETFHRLQSAATLPSQNLQPLLGNLEQLNQLTLQWLKPYSLNNEHRLAYLEGLIRQMEAMARFANTNGTTMAQKPDPQNALTAPVRFSSTTEAVTTPTAIRQQDEPLK